MRFWLSTLLFLALCFGAQAHEVPPAIADLEVDEGRLHLTVRMSTEPIIAGADLEGIQDTNATAEFEQIDTLRALSPKELNQKLRAFAPTIANNIKIEADGQPVPLTLETSAVDSIPNVELPRESVLWFSAELPDGARSLVLDWPANYGALILRQQGVEEPYTGFLQGGASDPILIAGGDAPGFWQSLLEYIPVGFDHIVPKGLDHILFVLGLFFLTTQMGPLLWQISAFTLAHTVTLALGALGIVNIPGSIVEPIIAASIVYVAIENIRSDQLNRWRPLVVFGFGLLHGLGFASVLGEFGLPQGQFISALIGFNIGVEIGQLAVIAVAFLFVLTVLRVAEARFSHVTAIGIYSVVALAAGALAIVTYLGQGGALDFENGLLMYGFVALLGLFCALACQVPADDTAYRKYVSVPASVVIAIIAIYWVIERVFL